jgi:tRNA U34 5-carboxymethylaminomethyl modifying GTPase MnmE/TrmE
MRIVLMGRTMAGKSTLLAALTGGSAERIGDGRQRYSRDAFAAPASDLPDVEIVDTPGVGAKDGADDVAKAMAEIPGADLVLWVAANDSIQEQTARALRAVAFRGKPVVVVLNYRAPLVDDLDREDFLADQDSVFAQYEGHFKTIRAHLSAASVCPVAEVMLHADAARQARMGGDCGAELREASRISTLLTVLEQECRERRTARRVLREADAVRSHAQALSEALDAVEHEVREIIDVGRRLRKDQRRRTVRLVDACKQRMEDDVVRLTGERQVWHQSVTDFSPHVAKDWDKEQAALVAELDEALKARLARPAGA